MVTAAVTLPPLVVRQRAAQATLDRFLGRPFAWGTTDCARVAAFHLKQLGHKPALLRGGSYGSELGAVRALKRAGHDDLAAAVDSLGLPRIAYAAHLVGDILGLKSAGAWPSLAVALGNGRVLTSSAELGVYGVAQLLHDNVLTCWRAHPCLRP